MYNKIKVNPVDCLSPDGLCIFLFHGVIEKNMWKVRNYSNKHLEREVFARMLKDLKSNANAVIVSMDEVIGYRENKIKFPPYSYAITFDDGFKNNCTMAAPILADFNMPATFYITTDFIDYNERSWADELEQCFERTEKAELHMPYDVSFRTSTNDEKIIALEELRKNVKSYRWPLNYSEVVDIVQNELGIFCLHNDKELDSKMSWGQVVELSNNSLFTIGGHTVTHAILSHENEMGLKFEIADGCIEYLKNKLNRDIIHFSYPEGLAEHYNEKVIAVLKDSGVKCCPTAISGVNIDEDLFNLKRIMVA